MAKPANEWATDNTPKKNHKPTANGKSNKHLTRTGKVEKALEERELRRLEKDLYAA